ncbi:MAG: hypothetical protein MJK12_18415 [Colwellia sp.]|nr:hypothetical protein [Colwellia sp.]
MTKCKAINQSFLLLFIGLISMPIQAKVKTETVFTYRELWSSATNTFNHQLLLLSLEKTTPKYGPFKMYYIPHTLKMNAKRARAEVKKNQYPNFIIPMGNHNLKHKDFSYAPFPIRFNLRGFRFFMSKQNPDDHPMLDLLTLHTLSIIQTAGCICTDILRFNGFTKVSEVAFSNLIKMVSTNRVDGLFTSLNIFSENLAEDLFIDPNIVLRYHNPIFFSSSIENKAATERIYEGLTLAHQDGSYLALLDDFYLANLKKANINKREIINLENPYLKNLDPRYQAWADKAKLYLSKL